MITARASFQGGSVSIHYLQYLMKGRSVDSQILYTERTAVLFILELFAISEASITEALNQARDFNFIVEELRED